VLKKGIALTPVKFGISFTATHLNQAGALVLVYADGSVQLNHGGTEMGQGLNIKVAQVVADVFAVPLSRIRITATRTDKVPNTSATAASSGSDLNGMAAFNAAREIREAGRLLAEKQGVERARCALPPKAWWRAMPSCPSPRWRGKPMARVQLWASGFYATPKIHYDRAAHQGHLLLFRLWRGVQRGGDRHADRRALLRADILHDAGRSLNPAIDLGQVEGGFIQGMGWLTTEELVWRPMAAC
jgi:xanthine dehydrogenase large subunit